MSLLMTKTKRFLSNEGDVTQRKIIQGRGYTEVIKPFSCSTQLSIKFVLLINKKKILTNANYFLLNIAEHEVFSANKYENANNSWHFHTY